MEQKAIRFSRGVREFVLLQMGHVVTLGVSSRVVSGARLFAVRKNLRCSTTESFARPLAVFWVRFAL